MKMLGPLKQLLPPAIIEKLRMGRNTLQFYRESLFAADKSAFRAALKDLGIRNGSLVFVQSAYDQMRSIRATPVETIEILTGVVGEAGTVVMPTFPMSGLSEEYLAQHPAFDWRRTPSRSGLLTEVFRRIPGTERSLHPTHPVAARGRDARSLTEGHERSETPFDGHSPFQKMLERNGLILSIGDFSAMTFRHLADHLMQDKIPHPIYSDKATRVQIIGKDGTQQVIVTRGHNPDITCEHRRVLERMAAEGRLKTAKARRVQMSLVGVRQYVESYQRDYGLGIFRHYLKSHGTMRGTDG